MGTVTATGQIELFRIEANGIVSTEVYYATSTRSDVPPGLDSVEFKIGEDIILGFEDVGASFHIHENNTLWGWYDSDKDGQQDEDEIQQFTVDASVIEGIKNTAIDSSGTTGWTKTIPIINPGEYLWTKTIQIYSDGSMTVTYGLYHWGADANTFKIITRFNEVIKFMQDKDGDTIYTFSPAKLPMTLWQQNSSGNNQLRVSKDKLSVWLVNAMSDSEQVEELGASYYEEVSEWEIQIDLQKYSEEGRSANNLKTLDSCYLKIVYEIQPNENVVEYIGVRFGSNYDMATLSLKATGWVSKAQDTFLTFDANGLTLVNGGVGIRNENGDSVFYADSNGNLCLTGTIVANAGLIGGFEIREDRLASTSGNIALNGDKGIITIGDTSVSGADYIAIDGSKCTIYGDTVPETGSTDVTRHWSITPTEAIFNNIVAKGSLKASVFEYGKIQAIGGIFIARPSSRIIDIIEHKNVDGSIFTKVKLEEREYFTLGDECIIGGSFTGAGVGLAAITCFVCKVPEETGVVWLGNTYIDLSDYSFEDAKDAESQIQITKESIGEVILNLGKKDDIGIGINGSNNNSFIEKNAVSVFSKADTGINTHIVLGKFGDDETIYGALAGQYGLYADNVFLHGALVTKNQSDKTYSGINTIYSSDSPMSEGNSPIIFWAGAEGDTTEDIKNSPFLVDSDGRVYAQEAHITGSVIVGSLLDSPQIRTATIVGDGKMGYALTIEDLGIGKGLAFVTREGNENNQISLFSLNTQKIYSMLPYQGTEIYVGNSNCLKITEEGFVHGNGDGLGENEIPNIANKQSISFNNADPVNGILGEIVFKIDGTPTLRSQETQTFIHNDLKVEGDLWCDDKLKYQKTNNGYDLYVYD